MKLKPLSTILREFYAFVLGRLVPMLAAWPIWSLRTQRHEARLRRIKRGNPKRNPTALR